MRKPLIAAIFGVLLASGFLTMSTAVARADFPCIGDVEWYPFPTGGFFQIPTYVGPGDNTNSACAPEPVGIAAAAALALGLLLGFALPELLAGRAQEAAAALHPAATAAADAKAAKAAAAAIAQDATDGLIAPEAASASAFAANAAAWEAAQAQAAEQDALAAWQAGDLADAEAAWDKATNAALAGNRDLIFAAIAGVNPSQSPMNCSYVALAVDERFAGDFAAVAEPDVADVTPSDLESSLRGPLQDTTPQGIEATLGAAGNGARGVVVIEYPGGTDGHALNVIQLGGTTYFVDGQLNDQPRVATSLDQLYPDQEISKFKLSWHQTYP
jgi:hypothetical protein